MKSLRMVLTLLLLLYCNIIFPQDKNLQIHYPSDNSLYSSNSIELRYTAPGADKIKVFVNGDEKNLTRTKGIVSSYSTVVIEDMPIDPYKDCRIVISSYDRKGIKIDSKQITLRYKDDRPALHVLSVGINNFQDNTISKLAFPSKDAKDFLESINKYAFNDYLLESQILLNNEKATSDRIYKELTDIKELINPGEIFFFYISTHGEELDDNFYFYTHDTDTRQVAENSISGLRIKELIKEIIAKDAKVVMFVDACYAGSLFRNKSSKEHFTFAQPGSVCFFSSRGDEVSTEKEELRNGTYTYALINALKGAEAAHDAEGNITIRSLADYLESEVAILTDNRQHPGIENTLHEDYILFKMPEHEPVKIESTEMVSKDKGSEDDKIIKTKTAKLPQWMMNLNEGEYLGISLPNGGREQALLSALINLMHNRKTGFEGKAETMDVDKTVSNTFDCKFDYSMEGPLSFNLINECILSSGENVVLISTKENGKFDYNDIIKISGFIEMKEKQQSAISLDGNYAISESYNISISSTNLHWDVNIVLENQDWKIHSVMKDIESGNMTEKIYTNNNLKCKYKTGKKNFMKISNEAPLGCNIIDSNMPVSAALYVAFSDHIYNIYTTALAQRPTFIESYTISDSKESCLNSNETITCNYSEDLFKDKNYISDLEKIVLSNNHFLFFWKEFR